MQRQIRFVLLGAVVVAALAAAGLSVQHLAGAQVAPQLDTVGSGLRVEYFVGTKFEGKSTERLEPNLRFVWETGGPIETIGGDSFSARFTGDVVAPTSGVYTFFGTADDGVRLSVNGQEIFNDWNDHARRTVSGRITLVAGQRTPINLEYYENTGLATLRLQWSGPGFRRQTVPATALFPSAFSKLITTSTAPPSTTLAPTTSPPTTVVPTTSAPMTVTPTTVEPTTSVPATSVPATLVPTTLEPTTLVPNTVAATTIASPTTIPDSSPLFTRTYFVSPKGDDSSPGSAEKPWGTLQRAVDTLKAGERVLVATGEYSNGLYIENKAGEPGRPITFAAAPGAKPIVRLKNLEQGGVIIKGSSYITIDGIEFSYEGPDASAAKGERFEAGISVQATDKTPGVEPTISHHIQLLNNNAHGFPGAGINIIQADYVLAEGNTVWDNSKWSLYNTSGISIYESVAIDQKPGAHNVIRNNTVFQNENRIADPAFGIPTDGNCIIVDDNRRTQDKLSNKTKDGAYEPDTLVENNVCAGNGGSGVRVFNSDNVLVRHNSLYNNQRTAAQNGAQLLASFYPAPEFTSGKQVPVRRGNNRFVNNVVVWDPSVEAAGTPSSAGALLTTDDPLDVKSAVFVRNFYFGSLPTAPKPGVYSSASATDIIGTGLPFVKPNIFASSGDFGLLPGSGAVDVANAGDSPNADRFGTPRPQGTADLGAIERRN